MFSLENLAVGTVIREKYGVIDDEYGTPIPLSEVGPFAGRLMWFPPYNVEINEVAIAKYESTVMVVEMSQCITTRILKELLF